MKKYYHKPAGHHSLEVLVSSEVGLQGLKDELKLSGFTFLVVDKNILTVFYYGQAGRQKLFDICEKRYEVRMKL